MKANYANALCHCNATPLSVAVARVAKVSCGENGAVFGGGLLSLSLSLSLVSFLFAIYFFNFLNLFARLVILSVAKNPQRLKENLPFLDTSLSLSMTNSGFCLKMTDKSHNFAHQKHFFAQILGTKFTNFTRFYGLPRSLCSLAMTARQKFKFFTQNSRLFTNSNHFINSRHFINSTHFINFSQILSHTQGFFIFLPQIFYIFTQIAFKILKNSTQGVHYER